MGRDIDIDASVKRYELFCFSQFPLGSREQILATAYTLAPDSDEECEIEIDKHLTMRWRVSRYKIFTGQEKIMIDLGHNACMFWSGKPEDLPLEIQ